MATEQKADQWAMVEVMGHRRLFGRVSEVQRFGAVFCRVEVPGADDTWQGAQEYGGQAIFCITPLPEEQCRRLAQRYPLEDLLALQGVESPRSLRPYLPPAPTTESSVFDAADVIVSPIVGDPEAPDEATAAPIEPRSATVLTTLHFVEYVSAPTACGIEFEVGKYEFEGDDEWVVEGWPETTCAACLKKRPELTSCSVPHRWDMSCGDCIPF